MTSTNFSASEAFQNTAFLTPPPPPAPAGGMAVVAEPAPLVLPPVTEEVPVSVVDESHPEPAVVPKKKRSKRLNPDSIFVIVLAVVMVFFLIAASFLASFNAIFEMAAHTGISEEWRWVFPVFIDIAIAAYTISLFVFRHAGKPVMLTLTGLILFALISVLVNVAHVFEHWDGTLLDYRAWIGVILAASAPIGVLLATEEIARLAFVEDPNDND